jgi:hypothetical protein
MGTPFEDALCAASAAVDVTFADSESWLYEPMAVAEGDVNARRAPDSDRAPVAIVGIFIDPYARAHSGAARRQGVKAERPGHASARPQIYFDLTQLGYEPRQGDRVHRCKTGVLYHIAEIKKDSAGPRAYVDLNELTGEAR